MAVNRRPSLAAATATVTHEGAEIESQIEREEGEERDGASDAGESAAVEPVPTTSSSSSDRSERGRDPGGCSRLLS